MWEKNEINKSKTNVGEKYCAVASCAGSIGAYHPVPATWKLPATARSLTSCWRTVLSTTHIFSTIEDDPWIQNWTGHTMIDGGTRPLDYVSWKPVLNKNSSEDGQCGGLGSASSGLCTGYSSSLYWVLFSLIFIHRLSWLINLLVGCCRARRCANDFHLNFGKNKLFGDFSKG